MPAIKFFFPVCVFVVLTACGGGGSGSDGAANVDKESGPDNGYPSVNDRSYPHSDQISFDRQDTGDVVSLSDQSLWYLVGDYSGGYDALGTQGVTVYEDDGAFGEPTNGSPGTHYMYLNGSTRAFFLEYIPDLKILASDTLPFHREKLGTLIALSNGTLWSVVGGHSSGQDVLGTHDVTLYTDLVEMPNIATTGSASDFYLHIESSSRGFYLDPLVEPRVETVDSAYFNRESVGAVIQLAGGSVWRVVGEHKFGYDVLDEHAVAVYAEVGQLPAPTAGDRSDHYLYIYGASAGFFVEPL